MNATEVFTRLRAAIESSELHLTQIAKKSGVHYHRLYRFWTAGTTLPLDDANKLFVALTGKSFISLPKDDNDL